MKFLFKKNNIICRQNTSLYLAESTIYKQGVYCNKDINKGTIIEECPLIIFENEQATILKNTVLYSYYFILQQEPFKVALAFGFRSIYNHFYPANAAYYFNNKKLLMQVKAVKDIDAGTEITINYNGDANDSSPVLFAES